MDSVWCRGLECTGPGLAAGVPWALCGQRSRCLSRLRLRWQQRGRVCQRFMLSTASP